MSRRKRQRLSLDGEDAVTASNEDVGSREKGQNSTTSKSKSVFVHSLPADATTENLTEHFSQFYPLKHAIVVTDPDTKQSKGYGFVTFADTDDAENAKKTLNGSTYRGKRIRVDLAELRHRASQDGHEPAGEANMKLARSKNRHELRQSEDQQPPKLIVRNLPWSIKESEQLATLFRSFGKVKFATMPKKASGLSAGYGFVTLRGQKNAEKALREMNGKEVDGRQLAVDFAVDKAIWQTLQRKDDAVITDIGMAKPIREDCSMKSEDSEATDLHDVATNHEEPTHESCAEESDLSSDNEVDEKDEETGSSDNSSTLFIRNIPFDATDEIITEHFASFGAVRYGRVVMDPVTERSRGTAFVCFYNPEDADNCLRQAPRIEPWPSQVTAGPSMSSSVSKRSILENTSIDHSKLYTIHDRVLQITRAVDRAEAKRLTLAATSMRDAQDKDKRRLYLLSEGTISAISPLYDQLPPSELKMREDSAKQRQTLIKSNPALHLSLTRLSVRNIPRDMTSKELKELARKAVVGFASDVKAGIRQPLSKEEVARGGEKMKNADRERKAKGKGIVRQAKIVFEGLEGSKVQEDSGAGRSRGYGFIEYTSHRCALMGLRWLNGHLVEARPSTGATQGTDHSSKNKKKRLVVEFAIENAQVVGRRREREANARDRSRIGGSASHKLHANAGHKDAARKAMHQIKGDVSNSASKLLPTFKPKGGPTGKTGAADKLTKRQQIIARKRKMRQSKRTAGVEQ
ncbi:nucleolar protein 4 [Physcia stellaris]|nr:nucleolar protein 4 [Physcia stellaris]